MNNHETTSDASNDGTLLRRFKTGSGDAATAIYLRYAKRLQDLTNSQTNRRHANEMDAEGIVQSVFRTFFRRVENGQYDVDDADSLWKLLLVITMNKIRTRATFLSASKRNIKRNVSLESVGEATHHLNGKDSESLKILQLTINELLSDYPPETRTIILLRIDGHSVTDIATQTGRSKRTVERNLQGFREMLHRQLEIE